MPNQFKKEIKTRSDENFKSNRKIAVKLKR